MNITTVGELIEALKHFDRDLPILKSDPLEVGYLPIAITEKMTFKVKRVVNDLGPNPFFVDELTRPHAGNAFDAVVL